MSSRPKLGPGTARVVIGGRLWAHSGGMINWGGPRHCGWSLVLECFYLLERVSKHGDKEGESRNLLKIPVLPRLEPVVQLKDIGAAT